MVSSSDPSSIQQFLELVLNLAISSS